MSEHIVSPKIYIVVFVVLLVLTVATTLIGFVDLGPFNIIMALVIAVVKAVLVVLFFMHVLYSPKLTKIVVAGGLLWLGILLVLSMQDFITRGWLPVPGK